MTATRPTLYNQLSVLICSMGFVPISYGWVQNKKKPILRIYIDCEAGITAANCATVSHQVSAFLDVENILQENYILEISSPGIGLPLTIFEDYKQHVGRWVNVRLRTFINHRQQYKGKLLQVGQSGIHILALFDPMKQKEMDLPFEAIESVHIIGHAN